MLLHQARATRPLRLRRAKARRTTNLSMARRVAVGAASAVGVAGGGAEAEAGELLQNLSSRMAGQTLPTREHRCSSSTLGVSAPHFMDL